MADRFSPRREAARAKVNLALHVTGRRADGYHDLESLVVFAAIGDQLDIQPSAADRFTVSGPFSQHVPTGADNLVLRALAVLRRDLDIPPIDIHLRKYLPPAAGIGGGSADAAALLRAVVALGDGAIDDGLLAIAATLGADVPMCLASRPLIARGRGTELVPIVPFPILHAVLVNPGAQLETPAVFKALRRRDNPGLPPLPASMAADALIAWLDLTRNDLEVPATRLCPAIGGVLDALRAAPGGQLARMSGSGATCFGLFDTADEAERAAADIARRHPGWWCVAGRLLGSCHDSN